MREILFRGIDEGTNEWVYGYYYEKPSDFGGEKRYYIFDDKTISKYNVLPETVGQYIGLADNKGKKIFEGDILALTNDFFREKVEIGTAMIKDGIAGIEYHTDMTRKYGWNPYFYRFGEVVEWRDMGASATITYAYEVIGNIHDNPELLEKGE